VEITTEKQPETDITRSNSKIDVSRYDVTVNTDNARSSALEAKASGAPSKTEEVVPADRDDYKAASILSALDIDGEMATDADREKALYVYDKLFKGEMARLELIKETIKQVLFNIGPPIHGESSLGHIYSNIRTRSLAKMIASKA
jgi:hypothetical protein